VIKEEDKYGSVTGNGSWDGMIGLVMSGNADIGVSPMFVTKEKSEVVAYTNTMGFLR
jgi:ABC-type amino acid transport substrate-binding protein